MPNMSADGNDRPTSTSRMRPSSSMQAMLRPTSPTPPRKTTRTFGSEETGILQRLADPRPFLRRSGDEREPRHAGREPDHLQRSLQRDRVAGDEQRVEQRRQVLVDLAGGGNVARLDQLDHLADLRAH